MSKWTRTEKIIEMDCGSERKEREMRNGGASQKTRILRQMARAGERSNGGQMD